MDGAACATHHQAINKRPERKVCSKGNKPCRRWRFQVFERECESSIHHRGTRRRVAKESSHEYVPVYY